MLERASYVQYGYDLARTSGDKHEAAMQAAVDYVKNKPHQMPISVGAVKRILAEWRSKLRKACFGFEEPDAAHSEVLVPEVLNGQVKLVKKRVWLTAYKAGRPKHPRSNAVSHV
jgi:hypothetical protein